jgi:dienelactone hydrolase
MRPSLLRATVRLATVGAGLALAGCAQPLTIAPSDADRVLASRSITARNPGEPGPLTVRRLYYGSGTDRRRAEFRDSVTYRTSTVDASPYARMEPAMAKSRRKYWGFDNRQFPRNARVWYPDGPGPYPLVLVVHGNHDMTEFSDPGYQWLGELLASRGFILASIDENFLNGALRNENDARGWMLLKHLELFRALNDSAGKPLHGKVDLSRIVLMGHSRGGEAVAIAGAFNRLAHYPDDATQRFDFNFAIRGLVAIAPVDGQYRPAEQPTPLADVSYLVIHGSHDGDVSSFMGLTQYNRIRFTAPSAHFKSAIWMHRANHGQWNTVWNDKDNGSLSVRRLQLKALIDGEEQRRFGRVVIGAFLETVLNGREEYRALFRDHRTAGDWLPPTMYLTRYADAGARWLATFEEDVDVTTGTMPGVRIHAESLSVWKESDVQARARTATFRSNAVTVGWNSTPVAPDTTRPRAPARYVVALDPSVRGALALTERSSLLLTMGTTADRPEPRRASRDTTAKNSSARADSSAASRARRSAAKAPPRPAAPEDTTPPDFTIELEDAGGRTVRLPLSTFGAVRRPIESYVYRRKGRDKEVFPTLAEQVMQTYVMPLSAFVRENAAFDPAALREVRLVFDRARVGQVLLDDIGVTRH